MSDPIERQAVIDALCSTCGDGGKDCPLRSYCEVVGVIEEVPSAEPERKTGIWMGSVCSECGNSTSFYYDCDYCPKCGAKMRGEHETD